MQLTKLTHHAIRILVRCARAGKKRLRAADIARLERITEYNVAKIVPILVRGGFVQTTRGRGGGLALARPADEIRIGDVVRATERAKIRSARKGGTVRSAPNKAGMPINQMVGDALEAFISVLDQHTIADLAGSKSAQEPVLRDAIAKKKPPRHKVVACDTTPVYRISQA
ncbi:RrF2 family transcriptional regulator [Methyloceanibacter methanicus]|nr:Rrf2 family transcriptional regulator [Methyloceanibacter methanicus]